MISEDRTRFIWLVGNLVFLCFYSLYIFTRVIVLPYVKDLPLFFSNIPLALSYFATLVEYYPSKLKNIPKDSNFYALMLILSLCGGFRIFMLPFYILSIFNVCSYVVSSREDYEERVFFPFCCYMMGFKERCVIYAYMIELIMPLVLIMQPMFFLKFNFLHLVLYCILIKSEYMNGNSLMKEASNTIFRQLDPLVERLPPSMNGAYKHVKAMLLKGKSIKSKTK